MSRKKHRGEDTWALIRESLDDFRPAQLAARLREYLAPRLASSLRPPDERSRRALLEGVDALLSEHAGAWYTHGFHGDLPPQGAPSEPGVEGHIERILSTLGVAHEWLCTLDTYFRSVALPPDEEDRAAVLSDAVRRVLELTSEAHGEEEAWHPHAHLGLGWLLESQGIRRTERLEQALHEALADFTRAAPSPEEARRAADTIALAAVKEESAGRYRDEGVS
ncbi:hypothetical protein [Archangium violaceum]|uniref:hypothetical protein n=1 Tax=Archangium violaceum TaxID=83451 RepID=UPI0036D969C9